MIKRVLTVGGVFGLISIALAATAIAGGGGGGCGPGKCTFSDWTATANFTPAAGGEYSNVSVYVDRGKQTFRPKKGTGTPFTQEGTILQVNESKADGTFAFGCWMLKDSSKFVVASDLSSASITYSATADEVCGGIPVGKAAGARPGLQSVIAMGGPGPGPGTQLTTVSVSVTWTGNGALWQNSNSGSSRCESYHATFKGTFDYEYAPATGTVDDLTGTSDPYSQIGHNTQVNTSNGIPSGACNPPGF
ncbi:MAG TPA: hypothetical protein VJT14_15780 [Candidatus Dormibacteraeota bacterium]|nr:hypothetical protein [Candidatus Dormibacteraeota bacterium]